jgi:hypothetical protein
MTVVFALLDEGAEVREPWRGEPAPRPQPRHQGARGRLLVVDDDELLRRVVGRMLEEAGYEVVLAGDGVDALACVAGSEPFAAVVADLRMPRMGGRTLGERLASLRPDLPVLYISGYASDWQPDLAAQPARAFLPKPFAETDLLRSVQALLGDS